MNLFVNGIFLAILMLFVSHGEAALAHGRFKDDKHPGKCVIKPDLILSPGEKAPYPDMACARVTCGTESMGTIETCGVIAPPSGYKLGEPLKANAEYPECCNREFVKV